VGSIKWQEKHQFDTRDLARLTIHRAQLPGADDNTPMLAIARSGSATKSILVLGPDDLIEAWR
jgi:hypothetical protein